VVLPLPVKDQPPTLDAVIATLDAEVMMPWVFTANCPTVVALP